MRGVQGGLFNLITWTTRILLLYALVGVVMPLGLLLNGLQIGDRRLAVAVTVASSIAILVALLITRWAAAWRPSGQEERDT
jgi:fumarate reductase subunit D